jgi:hypothetical protein
MVLGPQYRELILKMSFSMERAGLPEMATRLLLGLCFIWFFTGSVQTMREFIIALFNGTVFVMNGLPFFVPKNTPTDLMETELTQRLLLYNPRRYPPQGLDLKSAKLFFDLIGTPPRERPWLDEWHSEMQELRRQAVAELGEQEAYSLCAEVGGVMNPKSIEGESKGKNQGKTRKVAYW